VIEPKSAQSLHDLWRLRQQMGHRLRQHLYPGYRAVAPDSQLRESQSSQNLLCLIDKPQFVGIKPLSVGKASSQTGL
jgi:hypothetical protein